MKRRLVWQGIDRKQPCMIPVWNKKDGVYPLAPNENPLMRELGLSRKFVIMYSSNAGLVHRFEEVRQAMRCLKGHPDILLLFVGGGRSRARQTLRHHGDREPRRDSGPTCLRTRHLRTTSATSPTQRTSRMEAPGNAS